MPPDELRALIDHTGLTVNEFARTVLGQDARTVRRYLSGDETMPRALSRWLVHTVIDVSPAAVTLTVVR